MSDALARWRLEGRLKTLTPLRIGSGGTYTREDLKDPEAKEGSVEVNAVLLDHRGKPYLPGSTLKGVLRAWLKRTNREIVESLMGTENLAADAPNAMGASMEIENAYLAEGCTLPEHTPWQSDARHTGIRTGIARDVHTLAVLEDRLYQDEFVPTGAEFEVVIVVHTDRRALMEWLVSALYAFNTDEHQRIGADTGFGYGRLGWCRQKVTRYGAEEVQRWLQELTQGKPARWDEAAGKEEIILPRPPFPDPRWRPLSLRITLDTPFLVNDPELALRKKRQQPEYKHATDFNPRRTPEGKVHLPGHSMKGALRAQAERILRTLGVPVCDRLKPCPPYKGSDKERTLCPACQFFGNAGWGGLMRSDDFVAPESTKHTQEFVAIDRCAGGAAQGAKFNATAAKNVVLEGTLWLDTQRIEGLSKTEGQWIPGLLVRLLRDLAEGDISLGYGRSKGLGVVREVTAEGGGHWRDALAAALGEAAERSWNEAFRIFVAHNQVADQAAQGDQDA